LPAGFKERFLVNQTPEELGRKIKEAQERQGQSPGAPIQTGETTPAGRAMRAGIDLAAALLVGGFLGYWLDKWLNTKPLFMILLFFMGFAAGFLNIYRSQTGQDFKIGMGTPDKTGHGNEKKE
jgi:ATP synthase protein I